MVDPFLQESVDKRLKHIYYIETEKPLLMQNIMSSADPLLVIITLCTNVTKGVSNIYSPIFIGSHDFGL